MKETRDEKASHNLESRKPLKIIIDSSFFFIPSEFRMDIFEELAELLNQSFEPIITSPTLKELQRLARNGSTKLKRQASLGLKFAEKCHQIDVERGHKESHDDVIVRIASEMKCCVATNDKALRKRLRSVSVPVIYLRQESHFAMDGSV